MLFVICVLFFALCFSVKGGGMRHIFPWWDALRSRNVFLDRLLDGKVLSTILVGAFSFIAFGFDYQLAAFVALVGWLVGVAPSMGEEHGAVGTIKRGGGNYLRWMPTIRDATYFGKTFYYTEGRDYGIKKAFQRGVWGGAMMAIATGSVSFVIWSLAYPLCVFIGQTFYLWKYDDNANIDWRYSEPLIGAVCYGLPMAIILSA